MYCFGLSKTFVELVLSRGLNGALNGNIGVMKSMMAEITDETNLALAYSYMPLAWSGGGAIGPMIGGLLSRPADRFPGLFGNVEFFKIYPYFLACAVPATFTAIAWLVTFLFLKEASNQSLLITHNRPLSQVSPQSHLSRPIDQVKVLQKELFEKHEIGENTPLPLRQLLIPRVLIAAGNYATISLVEIAFRAVQPVFYATPIELGGLGLDPPRIGNILAAYGVLNGFFQIFFFADLNDWFGLKAIYTTAVVSSVPLVLTFPLVNALARAYDVNWAVWTVVGTQIVGATLLNTGFACIFIYIAAASPNRGSLGATNGIAQMLVSIVRTIGPASATSMFSFSIETPSHAWFIYYYLLTLSFIGIGASLLLPRKLWKN
ncbi:hypothetical protein ID866_5419 [Astraeus odoratus]|nr:hypothetical protein ID866_5419 [Astraeus odoratus]